MAENFYTATPRKARKWIEIAIQAGLVPFITASPGVGKSAIVKSVAKSYNLQCIDHRLSTSDPTDLSGLPFRNGDKAAFLPYDIFPLDKDPIPQGKEGFMIFFDEFNSAERPVQAATYKVILDRLIGQQKLHPNTAIVAAGNRATDRAIVNELSTAMQSRVIHIEMVVSHKEWLEDVALAENYDNRVVAYLSAHPGALDDFRPDHDERTFCCPRTWEFANSLCKIIKLDEMDENAGLFAGTITSGEAAKFVQFCKVFESLPRVQDILTKPNDVPIPTDSATCYAVVTTLGQHVVNDKSFEAIATYINRFHAEFRTLFYRTLRSQKPEYLRHPIFVKAMIELITYLNTD